MKTRLLLVPLCLAAVAALAAGCGGGGSSVSADSVAVVGSTPITKSTFSNLMNVGLANFQAHGQKPPTVGTPLYTQLKQQAVTFLVQQEEFTQEGQKLGVSVTQKDIDAKVAEIRSTYFHGSEKKLDAALKKNHVTLAEYVVVKIRPDLLGQKLYDKVTSSVTVSKADARRYYDQNKATFTTTSPNRSVRHILVGSRSLAEKLETRLKNGASFAQLANKYSRDTGSAQLGGMLTAVKGQLLKPFEKAAFSLKTGTISQPVHTVDGWHIIQALGPIRSKYTLPFSQAEAQIQQNFLNSKKGQVWTSWLAKVKKDYQGKVSYQTGYEPPSTTFSTTSSGTSTLPATTGG